MGPILPKSNKDLKALRDNLRTESSWEQKVLTKTESLHKEPVSLSQDVNRRPVFIHDSIAPYDQSSLFNVMHNSKYFACSSYVKCLFDLNYCIINLFIKIKLYVCPPRFYASLTSPHVYISLKNLIWSELESNFRVYRL